VVAGSKETMKQAQKDYTGIQNKVRDEFLNQEVKNQKSHKYDEKQQEKTGFDPTREYMKLISGGRA